MMSHKAYDETLVTDDMSIFLTGGTGSFGQAFVERVLKQCPKIRRLVVFSRDELKQFEMQQRFPESKYPGLRYMLGDVRDRGRLVRALEGIDIVVHAAALKQVVAAEYNPMEYINTNVLGAENLIEACLSNKVSIVIALSTDKAAAPINLYGATKLCSDKLFIAANNIRGSRNLRFSVVRYGNVMGSRGSVIPFFLKAKASGVLPITDPRMTRFNITLEDGVKMVLWSIRNAQGAEILVPKIPSYRILDVAEAVGPECEMPVVGIRPGEKIHEEMITVSDSLNTVDIGDFYAILPASDRVVDQYLSKTDGRRVDMDFSYQSGTNEDFLTVDQLRALIADHVVKG